MFLAISVFSPRSLPAQESHWKQGAFLTCTVKDHGESKTLPQKVTPADFQRLHCAPQLEYFQALDAAPAPEYAKLRTALPWTVRRTIDFKAGVTSGKETFEIGPGIQVIRLYSAANMTVSIENNTDKAIFVEGYDAKGSDPVDITRMAYVAIPAHKRGVAYRVDAFVADPVWSAGKMQINLMSE